MLPQVDTEFLAERFPAHSVQSDGGMICVLLPQLVLPDGLSVKSSDLLLRLATGYPDVPPDMWWFSPGVFRHDGGAFPATEVQEIHLGRSWQRWSRHLTTGQWRSGIDNLQCFIAIINKELNTAALARAA